MQPGSAADDTARAGAAPRSINWRHRLTPLVERGFQGICSYRNFVKSAFLATSGVAKDIRFTWRSWLARMSSHSA